MNIIKPTFRSLKFVLPGLFSAILTLPCLAMEFEPRQWSHLPVGMNFAGIGYAYTEADISLDPVLQLDDVQLDLHTWAGKYIRTFGLFEKSARIDLIQAYQKGEWTGLHEGIPASVSRSGWSDTFARLAVNLYGAPPLSRREFAAYRSGLREETIVGMGLVVRLPTGEYMDDKLINLGQNRFAFRPQLGVSHSRGQWTAEVTGEAAFYTDNDEFFNGNKLEQAPLYIIHGHLIYTFRPGLWVSASAGYDYGGENTINGVKKDDNKQDVGWALSFAYPINRQAGIKATYIGSRKLESTGLDSDSLIASLSFSW
jgi:hypothetical protein